MITDTVEKAKQKAARFLSFKARTEKEVRDKLRDEDFSQEIVEDVIEMLKKYDYVNDERFARDYARERTRLKGHGIRRIEYELKRKGVCGEHINSAVASLCNDGYDETETALRMLEKKCKQPLDEISFKEKTRLFNYLMRQGYDIDIIKSVLRT